MNLQSRDFDFPGGESWRLSQRLGSLNRSLSTFGHLPIIALKTCLLTLLCTHASILKRSIVENEKEQLK